MGYKTYYEYSGGRNQGGWIFVTLALGFLLTAAGGLYLWFSPRSNITIEDPTAHCDRALLAVVQAEETKLMSQLRQCRQDKEAQPCQTVTKKK